MSPLLTFTPWCKPSFPRVSGDEPGIQAVNTTVFQFSPRERG